MISEDVHPKESYTNEYITLAGKKMSQQSFREIIQEPAITTTEIDTDDYGRTHVPVSSSIFECWMSFKGQYWLIHANKDNDVRKCLMTNKFEVKAVSKKVQFTDGTTTNKITTMIGWESDPALWWRQIVENIFRYKVYAKTGVEKQLQKCEGYIQYKRNLLDPFRQDLNKLRQKFI